MNRSSDFKVTVAVGGFVWRDGGTPLLIDPRRTADGIMPNGEYEKLRRSDPVIELPERLFERFAEIYRDDAPETERHLEDEVRERLDKERLRARILDFANSYGFLLSVGSPLGLSTMSVHHETEGDWYSASQKMYRAWKSYDLVRMSTQDDLEGRKKRAVKEELEQLYRRDRDEIRNALRNNPVLLGYCDLADKESNHGPSMVGIENAVLAYVGSVVDTELQRLTALGMAWDDKAKRLTMQYRTRSLAGFLWLQFTEYMTNLKRFNFCLNCHKPLPIVKAEGQRSRSDKKHCDGGTCNKARTRKGERVRPSYNRASST